MSDDGPYYDAERLPKKIKWRPVKRRETANTDHGPIILYPGKHVRMLDLENGHEWGNQAKDFIRRHKLTGKALEEFKKNYPDVEIPE
jgi:hypothetical protein